MAVLSLILLACDWRDLGTEDLAPPLPPLQLAVPRSHKSCRVWTKITSLSHSIADDMGWRANKSDTRMRILGCGVCGVCGVSVLAAFKPRRRMLDAAFPPFPIKASCANWSSTLLVKLGERIELDSLSVVLEFRCFGAQLRKGIMPDELKYHRPESNLASCPSLVFSCPTSTGRHKQHTAKRQAPKKC